ncbi:MAG: hypothetical protein M1812_006948 [Candelaria pacifica]|nr:MAG: hypothetical protein M1812_006948 [Candelaria pacifica]
MALALSYCHLGHASTTTSSQSSDWEEINHADLKEDNILMFPPTPITTTNGSGQTTSTTSLNPYPHLKLADFGLSFTMPNRTIRTFKSSRWNQYGTPGYQAPEITMHNPFHQQPQPHQQPENQNPKQKFIIDPETNTLIREKQANPYPDHGAHTDIYALGRTIQSLAEIAFPNHTIPTNITTTNTNTPNTNTPNTNTPNTNTNDNNENTQIYTPALLSLLSSCLHPHGPSRISTSNLLKETSIAYQTHLTLIQTAKQAVEKESTMTTSKEEEEERGNVNGNSNGIANGNSIFQIYPGRILYTQSEKNLFLRNPFFRRAFEELNQVPFRKKSPPKIPPRPNIIRGKRRYKGNDQKSSSIRAAAAEAEAAAAGGIGEGKRGGKLNGGEHPPEFKVLNDADGDGDEDVDDDVVFGKEFVSVGAGVGKVIGRESGRTNEELQQFEDLKFHSPIQPLQPLPPPPPQPPVLVAIPKETKKKSAEGENGNNLVDEVGVGGGPGGRVGNRNRNRNRNLMGLDGVLESAMRRRGGRGRGL